MEPEITFVGSICRICLQLSVNRYDILKSGLQYLYCELTGINIIPNEGLPAVMCPSCVFTLNKALRFRRKCLESNFYLRDFICSGQTEFDTECSTAPYLALHVSETVVCEVPSTTHHDIKVEHQSNISDAQNQEFMSDFVTDFEPFSVNGINIEPVPITNYPLPPSKSGHSEKRKINQAEKNPDNSLEMSVVNMQNMMDHRSMLEVPLNDKGNPDIERYFGANLGQNALVEYKEKNPNNPKVTERTIEDVTIDERCLYIMKPQYRKLSKGYKAQDGTVIKTTDLMGPKYLRIEHLTVEQQLAELEKKRNSEKYLTRKYKCVPCALSFTFELQYNSHLKKHHVSTGPYQCSICTVRLMNKQGFQRHNNAHRMHFICVICGKKLYSRKIHAEHVMNKHIGLPEILCLLCNKKYKNFQSIKKHNKWYHDKGDLHYQCPYCPQTFKRTCTNTYHKHLLQHNGKSMPFSCSSCPKSFLQLFKLKQHRALVHEERNLRCENCKGVFPSQFYLDKHEKRGCNKPFNFYKFECEQCPKVFTSQGILDHHTAMYHEKHKARCHTCHKTFPNEIYLKKHNSQGHERACCVLCNKQFGNHYKLTLHLRAAHKIKPDRKIRMKKVVKKTAKKTKYVNRKQIIQKDMADARSHIKVLEKDIIKATSFGDFRNFRFTSQSKLDEQPDHCNQFTFALQTADLNPKCNESCNNLTPDLIISDSDMIVTNYEEIKTEDLNNEAPVVSTFPRNVPILKNSVKNNDTSRILSPIKLNPKQTLSDFENDIISKLIARQNNLFSKVESSDPIGIPEKIKPLKVYINKRLNTSIASENIAKTVDNKTTLEPLKKHIHANLTVPSKDAPVNLLKKKVCFSQKYETSASIEKESLELKTIKCELIESDPLEIHTKHKILQEKQTNYTSANVITAQSKERLTTTTNNHAKNPADQNNQNKTVKKYIPLTRGNLSGMQTLQSLNKGYWNSKIVLEKALRPDLLDKEDRMKLTSLINKIEHSKPTKTVMIMKVNGILKAYTLKTTTKSLKSPKTLS